MQRKNFLYSPILAVVAIVSLLMGMTFADTNPLSDRPLPHAEAQAPDASEARQLDAVNEVLFADLAADKVTAIDKLPKEVQPLAKAIASDNPGAKFAFSDGTLTVDLSKLIGSINPLSDCPNNTQFNVNFSQSPASGEPQKKHDKLIERITVAWTRLRHRAPDALVLAINITDRQSEDSKSRWKNYDVQLNLEPRLSRGD